MGLGGQDEITASKESFIAEPKWSKDKGRGKNNNPYTRNNLN